MLLPSMGGNKITVTETTNPATAECGMREFVVRLDAFTEVTLVVSQRRDVSVHDEPVRLSDAGECVSNADLTVALVQLAARAVGAVGKTINGDEEGR